MVYLRLVIVVLISMYSLAFAGKVHDFKLKNLENKKMSYLELKGEKLTILDFWATWCKPCLRSIPKLVELYGEFKEKGVQMIGISVDSPRNLPKVKPLSKSLGINYPVLLDSNSETMSRLQVTVVPTLLVIDQNDDIVLVHRGYRPGDEEILKLKIEELLSGKGPSDD